MDLRHRLTGEMNSRDGQKFSYLCQRSTMNLLVILLSNVEWLVHTSNDVCNMSATLLETNLSIKNGTGKIDSPTKLQ